MSSPAAQQEQEIMPRTKLKPEPVGPNGQQAEVLNLTEAAAYLRLAQQDVLRMVREQSLPGRQVGEEWRFLRSAIQDWLRTGPARSSKEAQLALAGAWKDDPHVEEELKEIYRRRERPMTRDEP
jgi:excisionase family DNA binding protein